MRYRTFGRTGWQVAEIGYGMWGMGGWTGSEDDESLRSLAHAIELGCNFFDTAWIYGNGRSERLLGETLRTHRGTPLYTATKIPPKNLRWPARATDPLDEVFPLDHIREYTEKSLENLGVDAIDLQQLHVWSDAWAVGADAERWQRTVQTLKAEGLIKAFGISLNRWEPENGIKAIETGFIDSVQVVYNIFDQAPEDALIPVCERYNVAVIARVPFDEGSLTGALRPDSQWPDGDWRNIYFKPENLRDTLERVEQLKADLPADADLPDVALRYILEQPAVSTTIPGMRKLAHVDRNLAASGKERLPEGLTKALRRHRWDRTSVIP